jgi:hypothetical protein
MISRRRSAGGTAHENVKSAIALALKETAAAADAAPGGVK